MAIDVCKIECEIATLAGKNIKSYAFGHKKMQDFTENRLRELKRLYLLITINNEHSCFDECILNEKLEKYGLL